MFTATNILDLRVIREKRIPFIVCEPKSNAESLATIRDTEEFFTRGRQRRFPSAEEIFDDLGI